MDWFQLLLIIHLLSLTIAATDVFAGPVLRRRRLAAEGARRETLDELAAVLGRIGGAGFGLLILSGIVLFLLRGYSLGAMPFWFYAKVVLFGIAVTSVFFLNRVSARAVEGDAEARRLAARIDVGLGVLFVLVIGSAVLAFN